MITRPKEAAHEVRPRENVVPACYIEGANHGHRKVRQLPPLGTVTIAALLFFVIVVSQWFYATTLRCSNPSALSSSPSPPSSSSSSAPPLSFSAIMPRLEYKWNGEEKKEQQEEKEVKKGGKQEPPVHPLLLHPTVAISFHWDVNRLAYLEYLLTEIQAWKSPRVDVCVGTNEPTRLRRYMSGSMRRLNATGNVHACPIALPLDKDYMLNWRTREVLGQKFNDTLANYTSFVFLENDLPLSWDAMVAWAEDTVLLEPYHLKRNFYRIEIHPDTGEERMQDYIDGNFSYVSIKEPGGRPRRFVGTTQGSYSGMFAATRRQMERYMGSLWWPSETGVQCCALEFASWGFVLFEQPTGDNGTWSGSGVFPWDEDQHRVNPSAALHHLANTYVSQNWIFSQHSVNNVSVRMEEYMASHPPMEFSAKMEPTPVRLRNR